MQGMEQGVKKIAIEFRTFLYKLCLFLALPEPMFCHTGDAGCDCEVLVVASTPSEECMFSGGIGGGFVGSVERASKKMVLYLVDKFGVRVDDINLQLCRKYEEMCGVFSLNRKQLELIGKKLPYKPVDNGVSKADVGVTELVVSIDFFRFLTEIVSCLGYLSPLLSIYSLVLMILWHGCLWSVRA